jgi:predicted Zn-dependent protease
MSAHVLGTAMLGSEGARRLLEDALRRSAAEQTEVVLTYEHNALTRFAGGAVHQNVVEETPTLMVRAVFGRRAGIASTTRIDDAGIAGVLEQAAAIARRTAENPLFPGLPEPRSAPDEAVYSMDTFFCTPERRAAMAGAACRRAREAGLTASGSVATTGQEIAVANSRGVFAYTPRSAARMAVVAIGEDGSGFAEDNALEMAALDEEGIAARAVDVARRAQHPAAIEPGEYTVVLQPEAVADLTMWLAAMGFSARSVDEGRSFVAGRRGEEVLGENISIWDDGLDLTGLPFPFDFEGMPRQRLSLIEHGIARDVALDTLYGTKLGLPANGHAVRRGLPFDMGPIPLHMYLANGTASVEEMIRSIDRGLLVTSFHYTRVVHPLHIIVTGMTRHGTFLIEHGEVARPVKNLRYTQSYVEALRHVQAIGSQTRLVGGMNPARVPALKIGRFTFTGVTE